MWRKNEPWSDGREWQERGVARSERIRKDCSKRWHWSRAPCMRWGQDKLICASLHFISCLAAEGRGWLSLFLHNLGSVWVCGCLAGGEGRWIWRVGSGLSRYGQCWSQTYPRTPGLLDPHSFWNIDQFILSLSSFFQTFCFLGCMLHLRNFLQGWGILVSVPCCTRFLPLSTNW